MIFVQNTPHNAGVAIYGDYKDFTALYDALHEVVGEEDENVPYSSSRLRVLAVCYDIRHALMGDRDVEFAENGMDKDKMKRMSLIVPESNLYLKINALWPEILFVTIALNEFVLLYAGVKSYLPSNIMLEKRNIWDGNIAHVRMFQAALMKCIEETVSETSFRRMLSLMINHRPSLYGYATQYLDILNCRFLKMGGDKRLASISVMTKRLCDQGDEYRQVKIQVAALARQYHTTEDDITPKMEYPENIDW